MRELRQSVLLALVLVVGVSATVSAQTKVQDSVKLGSSHLKIGDVINSHGILSKNNEIVVSKGGKPLQTILQGEARDDKRSVQVLAVDEAGDATSIRVTFKQYSVKITKAGKTVDVPCTFNGNSYNVRLVDGALVVRTVDDGPLDAKVEAEVKKAFQTDVGPVLVQRKLGKLLGGRTFQIGGTTQFSAEEVRKHMGLPSAMAVKAMDLSLRTIKKESLLNPRAAVFDLSLSLVGGASKEKEAQGLKTTDKLALSGTVILSVESGHILSVKLSGTTSMNGTMKQGENVFDINSSGTLAQSHLRVYSRG